MGKLMALSAKALYNNIRNAVHADGFIAVYYLKHNEHVVLTISLRVSFIKQTVHVEIIIIKNKWKVLH